MADLFSVGIICILDMDPMNPMWDLRFVSSHGDFVGVLQGNGLMVFFESLVSC